MSKTGNHQHLTDDPKVQQAMNALHEACAAAANRQGVTFKTLALVIHSSAGSASGAIGCTCEACVGYIMSSLGHALFHNLGVADGMERMPLHPLVN